MKYDLGFGESVVLREILFQNKIPVYNLNPSDFSYSNKEAEEKAIFHARFFLQEFMRKHYKYVGLSFGATGGIMAALRALSAGQVVYGDYFFPYYPAMIKQSTGGNRVVYLIDSPNNPTGEMTGPGNFDDDVTIFDAAYHSPAYIHEIKTEFRPDSIVTVGSFGKLTGLNGLRLGFYGTNDEKIYNSMKLASYSEALDTSVTSMKILNEILKDTDMWSVSKIARQRILDNRWEFEKIKHIIDIDSTNDNGMFLFPIADTKARNLLFKSGIIYIEGEKCSKPISDGAFRIRLNLGQSRDIVKEAIKEILKNDFKSI